MDKRYKVTSKYNGYVTVTPTNTGYRYIWTNINASLDLTLEEIKNILNTPGGRDILENKVIIEDADLVKDLGLDVEPEYYYTENDVENLLANGTVAQLKDTIDFAPEGTISLIVETATKMKLGDRNKLQVIKEMTGANVEQMITINATDDTLTEKPTTGKTRRAAIYKDETKAENKESSAAPVSKYKRI